jgi:hypothetical protein
MDTELLANAIRFYLRAVRRLGQAAEPGEPELWARAERAAERYARLTALVPVPVRRRPATPPAPLP